jgi:hypothetical protein
VARSNCSKIFILVPIEDWQRYLLLASYSGNPHRRQIVPANQRLWTRVCRKYPTRKVVNALDRIVAARRAHNPHRTEYHLVFGSGIGLSSGISGLSLNRPLPEIQTARLMPFRDVITCAVSQEMEDPIRKHAGWQSREPAFQRKPTSSNRPGTAYPILAGRMRKRSPCTWVDR